MYTKKRELLKPTLIAATILILCTGEIIAQQRLQFTQYMFSPLVINPAYAGADDAMSLTFIQRKQWNRIEGAPASQTLSGHTLLKKKNVGLGLTVINDRIGVHKNLNVLTNYAYHLKVGRKSYLSMGLGAGISNKKSDYGSLSGNSNNDPKINSAIISGTFFDLAMGLYFRSPKFHMGISAPELIPNNIIVNDTISIRLNKTNYFLFSKYRIPINQDLDMEPSVLFKYLPGLPFSYDLNLSLIYRKVLTMGLSYRKKESVDFLMKCQVTPQFQLGYAYDYPTGEVSKFSNGSHEVMVNYLFKYAKKNMRSPR